jgi:hypothetical protein
MIFPSPRIEILMKLSLCLAVVFLASGIHAQPPKFDSPKIQPPDEKTLARIKDQAGKLYEAIEKLPEKTPDYVKQDIEIYAKALEWALRHHEFFDAGKAALATAEQGLKRASEAEKAPWLHAPGKVVARAYRSEVDRSIQPYAVHYPVDYGVDRSKKWRLDILLHGRDGTICETKFLSQRNLKDTAKGNDFILIEIYGRGNNAYRWAGETDVFEAMVDFIRVEKRLGRDFFDPKRVVLRGFSMGGAGSWHLGLRHPDRWSVIGPGAGFTTTHNYVRTLPNPLPPYSEPLLHIYDAVDYAENAFNLPIVAYSGENDPQKQAADNVEERLKELKIDAMIHLIAPGLMHVFPPEWQKKAEAEFAKHAGQGRGRPTFPENVRFVTYTLKTPRRDWITLRRLERHYQEARVEAVAKPDGITLATRNIAELELTLDQARAKAPITIDGQKMPEGAARFAKTAGKWAPATAIAEPRKVPGLTGPIDDAFTRGFLCVVGAGQPYHDAVGQGADAQLQRFKGEWDKWMRGKLPMKLDTAINESDMRNYDLILFGDPASNSIIAKVLAARSLPLEWTKERLTLGDKPYDAATTLPMLVYPSPFMQGKYVVLNSGHTFHEAEFKGSNALLFPRLGDYAFVKPAPSSKEPAAFDLLESGIFDESWAVPRK